ncbi:hypothetical protein D4T97_004700 [Siminovitchia acidinfaciens]|uniref:Uncharacterized protein n=1 Tax=Siminovitchia acidinfaciens TaxID=2321395 RepID=A0A429Y3T3_9BACI|nr:hypothetical protein [Siminovitchia acidinfaciens]RST76093.1 hypothetical protein D4T97_004700 [Siminovitchia acidinfaciens]
MSIKHELEKSFPEKFTLTEKEKRAIRYRACQTHSSNIYLKPMLVSMMFVVIVGIVALSTIQSGITKEKHAAQHIPMKNHAVTPISEEQKNEYYKQYVKIVERAMQHKVGISIEVPPMEEFKETDWIEPSEYEKKVLQIVEQHLATEQEKIKARSTSSNEVVHNMDGSITKIDYIYLSDLLKEIEVTARFKTQYIAKQDRQLFTAVNDVSTQLANSPGNWKQTSYKASLKDGGQKYSIRIEGTFHLNNLSFEKAFTVDFNCDEYGRIQ